MSKVKQIHNEMLVEQSTSEIRNIITAKLQSLKGKIVQSDDRRIECDFGSLLKSRLIGEFWVSKSTLPKKAIIELGDTESGGTKITLDVLHTHKYGFKNVEIIFSDIQISDNIQIWTAENIRDIKQFEAVKILKEYKFD